MDEWLELHDSEIESVEIVDGILQIVFCAAYIWADGKGWSQKAVLKLRDSSLTEVPSDYPVSIYTGMLKVGVNSIDNLMPIPFSVTGSVSVDLTFTNGTTLKANGKDAVLELHGSRTFIENAGYPK